MNHYELGETIGSGSFGKVKKARHKITGHEGKKLSLRATVASCASISNFKFSGDQNSQQKENQVDGSCEQNKKGD